MSYAAERIRMLAKLTLRRKVRAIAAWPLKPHNAIILLLLGAVIASAMLTGCASFDKQYTVKPTITRVQVQVFWGTIAETKARCGQDALACATIGTPEKPMSDIYAVMPASFTDQRVCTLGEEFLHSLGARHAE